MQRIVKGDSYTIVVAIEEDGVPKDLRGITKVEYNLFDKGHSIYKAVYPESDYITIPNKVDGKIFIKLPSKATAIECSHHITQNVKITDSEGEVVTVLHETLTSTLTPEEY